MMNKPTDRELEQKGKELVETVRRVLDEYQMKG